MKISKGESDEQKNLHYHQDQAWYKKVAQLAEIYPKCRNPCRTETTDQKIKGFLGFNKEETSPDRG